MPNSDPGGLSRPFCAIGFVAACVLVAAGFVANVAGVGVLLFACVTVPGFFLDLLRSVAINYGGVLLLVGAFFAIIPICDCIEPRWNRLRTRIMGARS